MALKNFFEEFKKFAVRGNAMDMAVGIIIGAAFGKIVDSLVKDILMPPLGLLLGKIDFTNMFIVLHKGVTQGPYETLAAAQKAGAVTVNVGNFINNVISFTIIAFSVFLLIKAMNTLRDRIETKEEVNTKSCPYCCSEINKEATKCPFCTADLTERKKN